MEYVFIGLAVTTLLIACRIIWVWLFIPRKAGVVARSEKRMKALTKNMREAESRKRLATINTIVGIFRRFPLIGLSNSSEKEIRRLIGAIDKRDSMGKPITVEEVYFKQLVPCLALILVSFILFFFSPVVAFFPLFGILYFRKYYISAMEVERKELSQAISLQLYAFYQRYYVEFIRRDTTGTLRAVVASFMPQANEKFKIVLGRFQNDLEAGEDFAIRALDGRFSDNATLHKMCVVMKGRMKGEDASFDNMRAFMQELDSELDYIREVELKRRESRISKLVVGMLMICFVIIYVIQAFTMLAQ